MVLEREVSTNPSQLWASIERLTRPDGSIAASSIDLADGTKIVSTFRGPNVSQLVSFPDATSLLSLRMGETREVSVQRDGETVLRVAQLRRILMPDLLPPLPAPHFQLHAAPDSEERQILEKVQSAPGATVLLGLLILYNMATAASQAMGADADSTPVITFKIWTGGTNAGVVELGQEYLSQEQVALNCRALPDVQTWTNEAATELLPDRPVLSAKDWGNAVHWAIYHRIVALTAAHPAAFANVFPEITVDQERRDSEGEGGPRYGQPGTSRLDVLEKVSTTTYCVYDVKTGSSGLTQKRLLEILKKLPEGVFVYIMEVRPFE